MFKRFQGFIIGCLVCFLITGVVLAKTGAETIEALYNNIKIYVDGIKIEPKDANGNSVEPFIYNGTTYLPVRAVGEAIGKTVTWDGATQSVYLGEKPGDVQYLMDVCPPYEVDERVNYINWKNYHSYRSYMLKDTQYFEMAGNKYTNGFTLLDGGSYALFALNGKYSQMEFTIGHVDGSSMREMPIQFYIDGVLVKELTIEPESLPQKISLPLNNGLQLKVFTPESVDDLPYVGLGNITIK